MFFPKSFIVLPLTFRPEIKFLCAVRSGSGCRFWYMGSRLTSTTYWKAGLSLLRYSKMESMNCICAFLLLDSPFSSIDQFLLLPIPYWINQFSFLIDLGNCCKSSPALFLKLPWLLLNPLSFLGFLLGSVKICLLFILLFEILFSSFCSVTTVSPSLTISVCLPVSISSPVSSSIPPLPFPHLPFFFSLSHKWCFSKCFLTCNRDGSLWFFLLYTSEWNFGEREYIYLIWKVLDCFPVWL